MKPSLEELEDREDWRVPKLVASMWHCGDEVCNCFEPQIDLVLPGMAFPLVQRFKVWRGTFHSDPDFEEMQAMRSELMEGSVKFGIPMDEEFEEYGIREATPDEIREFKTPDRRC